MRLMPYLHDIYREIKSEDQKLADTFSNPQYCLVIAHLANFFSRIALSRTTSPIASSTFGVFFMAQSQALASRAASKTFKSRERAALHVTLIKAQGKLVHVAS